MKPWQEIVSSDEFQNLSETERTEARDIYFDAASQQIPQEDREAARQFFNEKTNPSIESSYMAERAVKGVVHGGAEYLASIPESAAVAQTAGVLYGERVAKDTAKIIPKSRRRFERLIEHIDENPQLSAEDITSLIDQRQTKVHTAMAPMELQIAREYATSRSLSPDSQKILRDRWGSAESDYAEKLNRFKEAEQNVTPAEERLLYKLGEGFEEGVKELTPLSPEDQRKLSYQASKGVGQMAAMIGTGLMSKPLAVSGGMTMTGMEGYKEARDYGASMRDATDAAGLMFGVGTTEYLPIDKLIEKLVVGKAKAPAAAAKGIIQKGLQKVAPYLKSAGIQGTEEALQEMTQTVLQNLIASDIIKYDEDREMFTGTGEAGEVAFTAGGLVGAIVEALVPGKQRGPRTRRTPEPQAEELVTEDLPLEEVAAVDLPDNIKDVDLTRALAEEEETQEGVAPLPVREPEVAQPVPAQPKSVIEEIVESDRPVADIVQEREAKAQGFEPVAEGVLVNPQTQEVRQIGEVDTSAVVEPITPETDPTVAAVTREVARQETDQPTEGQKEAGNYKKGSLDYNGLKIRLETPRGVERSGVDRDGTAWAVTMPADYGYIERTNGADGDQLDVYVGDNQASDMVYIINQNDLQTGKFDEHKIMLGFDSEAAAIETYNAAFSDGKGEARIGSIAPLTMEQFKEDFLKTADTKKPASGSFASNLDEERRYKSMTAEDIAEEKMYLEQFISRREPSEDVLDRARLVELATGEPYLRPLQTRAEEYRVQRVQSQQDEQKRVQQRREAQQQNKDSLQKYELPQLKEIAKEVGFRYTAKTPKRAFINKIAGFGPEVVQKAMNKVPPRAPRQKPVKSLLEAIAADGGIRDTGGDLKAMNLDLWHTKKRFRPKLVKEDGRNPDDVALSMWEKGYFPELQSRPDIDTLYEAMRKEDFGDKRYTPEGQDRLQRKAEDAEAAEAKRQNTAMQKHAERLGIDLAGKTPEEVVEEIVERIAFLAEDMPVAEAQALFDQIDNDTREFLGITLPELHLEIQQAGLFPEDDIPFDSDEEISTEPKSREPDAQAPEEDVRPAAEAQPTGAGEGAARTDEGPQEAGKQKLKPSPSYIVTEKGTNRVVTEIFSKDTAEQVNRDKYDVVPVKEHLTSLNKLTPQTEKTEAGEQVVVPGAEKISDKELAERKMKGRKKAAKPQKEMDEGLFDTGARAQVDLLDIPQKPASDDVGKRGIDDYWNAEKLAALKNQSPKSRDKLVYMAPSDFLDMADQITQPSPDKHKNVEAVVKSGRKFKDIPHLTFTNNGDGTATVVSHEGRHRAFVLGTHGVTKIPVIIRSSEGGKGTAIRWGEYTGELPSTLIGEGRNRSNTIPFPVKGFSEKPKTIQPTEKYSLSEHKKRQKRLYYGEHTADEVRQLHQQFVAALPELRDELNAMTKEKLRPMASVFHSGQMKKAELVENVLTEMRRDFHYGDSVSYNPFSNETYEDALDKLIAKQTDGDIKAAVEKRKASEERWKKEREETKAALDNPKSLDDFRTFVRAKGRDALTNDQLAEYDRLSVEDILKQRKDKASQGTVVSAGSVDTHAGEIVQTKHTKKGHDLFVVQLEDRVDKEQYQSLNAAAKRLGGYYSSYRAGGAVPGFQFTTMQAAEDFKAVVGGDEVTAAAKVKPETNSEQLRKTAATLRERAEASLGQERKVNTAKRAREAEGAIASAHADKAFAATMDIIAAKIEAGDAGILENVSAKTHIEALQKIMRRAMYQTDSKKNLSYAQRQKQEGRKFNNEDARNVEYPVPSFHIDHVDKIILTLNEKKGFKNLARHLGKLKKETKERGETSVEVHDPKYIDKVRDAAKLPGDIMGWYADEGVSEYRRMQALKIYNLPQLRHAVREYASLQQVAPKADPIRKAELELVGRRWEGYFPTPKPVADKMTEVIGVESHHRVLEPSAGKGDLIDAIVTAGAKAENVEAVEIVSDLREMLELKGYKVVATNFTDMDQSPAYDRIIMNPPFEKGQDIEHVMQAYGMLNDGGRLVAIMSEGPFFRQDKKATAFREWLENNGGYSEQLPEGSFKDSNTSVNTRLVVIDKGATFYQRTAAGMPTQRLKVVKIKEYDDKQRRMARKIKKIAQQKFGSGLHFRFVDRIYEEGGGLIPGLYTEIVPENSSVLEGIVVIALNDAQKNDKVGTLNHEGIHFLRAMGALDAVWGDLRRQAESKWISKYNIRGLYKKPSDMSEGAYNEMLIEEAVAEAYADYNSGRLSNVTPRIANAFKKIRAFFASVKSWVKGEGFNSWQDIFQKIDKGEFATEESVPARVRDVSLKDAVKGAIKTKKENVTETDDPDIRFQRLEPNSRKYQRAAEEASRYGKEKASSLKRWGRRNFTKEGMLTSPVFEMKIGSDGLKNASEFDIANLMADFDKDVREIYKKPYNKLTAEEKAAMRDYLAGAATPPKFGDGDMLEMVEKKDAAEAADAAVPEGMKERMRHMRDFLDNQSARMQDAMMQMVKLRVSQLTQKQKEQLDLYFETNGEDGRMPANIARMVNMVQTIEKNKGSYLNRSYQAFDDPKWKEKTLKNEEVMADAEAFIAEQNPDLTPAEVTGAIRAILQKAYERGNFTSFLVSGIKEGKKDVSFLKHRKDIPVEIRRLLGEYEDPKVNFTRSASNMANWLANQYFLTSVRNHGHGTFLFDRPTGEFDTQIAGKGDESMSPVDGLYTHPDFIQGLEDVTGNPLHTYPDWAQKIIAMNSMVKYGKTVLAPTTQFRNFMSAAMFTVMNGHFNWSHGIKSFKATKSDLFTNDAEWRNYLQKLIKLGVLHDNPYSSEIRAAIKDVTEQGFLPTTGPASSIVNTMQKLYRAGDDFWKIIGFENEVEHLMKNRGMTRAQAERKAAVRIRDGYPTYSMVPRAMRGLRVFPFVGTFVSFPWEIMRTSKNQLKFLAEDFKAGDKKGVAKRMVGMAAAAAIADVIRESTMALMGLDDDDDRAVRDLSAPWQANAALAYVGYDDNGFLVHMDLSFMDPYAYLKKPIYAAVRGVSSTKENIKDGIAEVLDPFLGPDILAQTIGEVVFNQKINGGYVYNPEDTSEHKVKSVAKHIKNLLPGFYNNVERSVKASLELTADEGSVNPGRVYKLEDEGLAWIGFRTTTMNIPQSLIYSAYEFSDRKRRSTEILSRVVGKAGRVNESDIKSAYKRMKTARNTVYGQMIRQVAAAKKLGISDEDITKALYAAGIGKADRAYLLRGLAPDFKPSRRFGRAATLRAIVSAPELQRKELIPQEMSRRVNIVRELLQKEAGDKQ